MQRKMAMVLCVVLVVVNSFLFMSEHAAEPIRAEASESGGLTADQLLDMDELCGWAAVSAEGIDGVSGGGNAAPQIATTLSELSNLAADNIPRVIVVSGRIECGSYGIQVGSNKTIVGLDKDATIYGGFRIHNQSNVIISNLNIEGTWPNSGPDDCLEVKNSHHLWFNHLNIWNSTDGNVDITLGSDYVTVSWCKMWYTEDARKDHKHRLSCLIGSGTGHDDTDMDKLRITYHHNWFADALKERMPRVMYGRVHVYNNYYSCSGNDYCIGADCYASVLIENNYFKNVKNPHEFSYGTGFPSCITARGNEYDGTSGKKDIGQGSTVGGYAAPFETTPYDYYLHNAKDIPSLVQKYAGTQDMSDASLLSGELKGTNKVEGVDDKISTNVPLPSATPKAVNDNPITYNSSTDTYSYHGSNKDGSNAYYEIENPFSKKDYSEVPTYRNGKPVWTKGATIAYWGKLPGNAKDAAVLNFNLENDRQMERSDAVKYNLCQAYSEQSASYRLGIMRTYVDANGKEYTALSGYGQNVQYNPQYPKEGYYTPDSSGGAHYVYLKGSDPLDTANWTYLNYIGKGYYEEYSKRFYEEGGGKSKIKEADISGSLSLYASGSMGYRQDNWTGIQLNPNVFSYGSVLAAQIYNQFYYWGNGGYYSSSKSNLKTPAVEKKDEWHFVVAVIQNDWIQYYMDGKEMTTDYLNWWGNSINDNTASESFNLGFGQKKNYKSYTPVAMNATGKTLLEFISDSNTDLMIGGLGLGAEKLGQNTIGTPNGTMVRGLEFYYQPVNAKCILADKIDLSLAPAQQEAPDKKEDEKPEESQKPEEPPLSQLKPGDIDGVDGVTMEDALLALKAALRIISLDSEQQKAADVDGVDGITLEDALLILKAALNIIKL